MKYRTEVPRPMHRPNPIAKRLVCNVDRDFKKYPSSKKAIVSSRGINVPCTQNRPKYRGQKLVANKQK